MRIFFFSYNPFSADYSPYRNFENVAEYQNQDPVKMYVDQFIDRDPHYQIYKETNYNKYLAFTRENGYPSLVAGWFSRKFKLFGPLNMTEGRPLKGGHKETWKGVKFKDGSDSFQNTDANQDSLEVE